MATFTKLKTDLEAGQVVQVPIKLLDPDPDQPRRDFDLEGLNELAGDIKRRGIQQPVTVRPEGKRFVLVYGERRLKAAKIVKLAEVPAVLYRSVELDAVDVSAGVDKLERMLDQVKENHLRRDLTPVEWADVFHRLIHDFGYKVGEIPEVLESKGIKKISRPYVSNLLRIGKLPKAEQKRISDGELTAAHAKPLLVAKEAGDDVYNQTVKSLDTLKGDISGESLTVDELNDMVYDIIAERHISLDSHYGLNAPVFDTSVCNKCPFDSCIAATNWNGDKSRFCKKPDCFNSKQSEAKKEKADNVRKSSNGGKQGEKDDKPGLSQKDRREREGRKVEAYMQTWFRRQFRGALQNVRNDVRASVVAWVTLGMRRYLPWMDEHGGVTSTNLFDEEAAALGLEDLGLAILEPVKPGPVADAIISRVADLAEIESVIAGCRALGVTWEPWVFDEDYLKCKMSDGLDELAVEFKIANTDAWKAVANKTNAQKRAVFLDPDTKFGRDGAPKDFMIKAIKEYDDVDKLWASVRRARSGAKRNAA